MNKYTTRPIGRFILNSLHPTTRDHEIQLVSVQVFRGWIPVVRADKKDTLHTQKLPGSGA